MAEIKTTHTTTHVSPLTLLFLIIPTSHTLTPLLLPSRLPLLLPLVVEPNPPPFRCRKTAASTDSRRKPTVATFLHMFHVGNPIKKKQSISHKLKTSPLFLTISRDGSQCLYHIHHGTKIFISVFKFLSGLFSVTENPSTKY